MRVQKAAKAAGPPLAVNTPNLNKPAALPCLLMTDNCRKSDAKAAKIEMAPVLTNPVGDFLPTKSSVRPAVDLERK